jgi:hypothetical protein
MSTGRITSWRSRGARDNGHMVRLQEPFRTIVVLKTIGLGVLVLAMAACLLYVLLTGR